MEAWIFVHDPLERYLDDYERIFDAWEAGGVRGIVVGYLRFTDENGQSLPTFHSDPAVYKSFGIAPPAEPKGAASKPPQTAASAATHARPRANLPTPRAP